MGKLLIPDAPEIALGGWRYDTNTSITSFGVPPVEVALRPNQPQTTVALVKGRNTPLAIEYIAAQAGSAATTGWRLNTGTQEANRFLFAVAGGSGDACVVNLQVGATEGWIFLAAPWNGQTGNFAGYFAVDGGPLTQSVTGVTASGSLPAAYSNQLTVGNREASTARYAFRPIVYVARWNRMLSVGELQVVKDRGPLAVPLGLVFCFANGRDIGPYGLRATHTAVSVYAGVPPTLGPDEWLFAAEGSGGASTDLQAAQALSALTQSVSATALVDGSASQTLADMGQSANTSAYLSGSASQQLRGLAQSASVALEASISAGQMLSEVAQSAAATTFASASAVQQVDAISQAAAVASVASASATQQLGTVSQFAVLTTSTEPSFTADQQIGALGQSASVEVRAAASAAQQLATIAQTGTFGALAAVHAEQQLDGFTHAANVAAWVDAIANQPLASFDSAAAAACEAALSCMQTLGALAQVGAMVTGDTVDSPMLRTVVVRATRRTRPAGPSDRQAVPGRPGRTVRAQLS